MTMNGLDPKEFVDRQVEEIRKIIGDEMALAAVSGGVDSTTCAVLTRMAIGENLICVTLDDGFRREGEPERVAETLSKPPLNLPVSVVKVEERFMKALEGLRDAEEKRKVFRDTFYKTLSEVARENGTRYLIQGTILADIVETKGGIKTQHNVLEQMGINTTELYGFKVVEPLVTLYKDDVRRVARYLKIPSEISERQPFPGPGLMVRVVGEVRPEKLRALKRATALAEEELAKHKPSQYFAAIIDDRERHEPQLVSKVRSIAARFHGLEEDAVSVKVLEDRATGVRGGARQYGYMVTLDYRGLEETVPKIDDLVELQGKITSENPSITRVLYSVSSRAEREQYIIALRAVETENFITADVAEIPWPTLDAAARRILEACPTVSGVYYDVTPKPPATIEME